MGYFDHLDDKIENVQEVSDVEKWAGTSFWYSIGSLGLLIHSIILCSLWGWTNLYTGIAFFAGIALSIVGLVYSGKSGRATALIDRKSVV